MNITKIIFEDEEIRDLWEQNMGERWAKYKDAEKFIQKDENGKIVSGFAVYYDESDGIKGNFISGWSIRKNYKSVEDIIMQIAKILGEVFIKTDKRQVSIIGNKLGEFIKKKGNFLYYIIRGN